MNHPSSRRGFLAAFGSFAGVAPAGIALPALAGPVAQTLLDPAEAPLIEAGRVWSAAIEELALANKEYGDACRAIRALLGPCPAELIMSSDRDTWDQVSLRRVWRDAGEPIRLQPEWDRDAAGDHVNRWDGVLLREAISRWPRLNGRGGTTPRDLRRFRALLPAAEARDALDAHAHALHEHEAKWDRTDKALDAAHAAERPILKLPASTLAGVAVKARLVAHVLERWRQQGSGEATSEYFTTVVEAALAAEAASINGES